MSDLFFAMFIGCGICDPLQLLMRLRSFRVSQSGLIAGVGAGSWSAVVALVMPIFGRLFDQAATMPPSVLAAIFPLLGYAGWRWMDRERHV